MAKKNAFLSDLMRKFKSDRKETKLSLRQLAWLGFNYTCGLGFVLTLSSTYSGDNGVGLHLIWIILLGAVIAGGAAWAFAKCSKVYSDKSGGPFEYAHRTFGASTGWMIGFYQYVLIPITTPSSILVIVKVSFEGLYDPMMWGEYTSLYLNIISIIIYIILSMVVLLGTFFFKWGTNICSVIKWIVVLVVYAAAITIMVRTSGVNFANSVHEGHLNPQNFNSSFSAFFYAYTGFETFACVTDNVKNPKKTMPKAIMLVLLGAVIFYIIGLIVVVGSISGVVPDNPENMIIRTAFGTAALTLIVVSQFASTVNGFMQGAFYSGGMLQPLSDNYMISNKIAKVNKNGLAVRALFVNMILTVIFSFVWLILPYLINQPDFKYAAIVGFNSIVTFIIYGTVMLAAIKLHFTHKIKAKWWELAIWIIVILFLISQVIMYFMDWETNKWQIITFLAATVLAVVYYYGYVVNHRKKLVKKGIIVVEKYSDIPSIVEENSKLDKKAVSNIMLISAKPIVDHFSEAKRQEQSDQLGERDKE